MDNEIEVMVNPLKGGGCKLSLTRGKEDGGDLVLKHPSEVDVVIKALNDFKSRTVEYLAYTHAALLVCKHCEKGKPEVTTHEHEKSYYHIVNTTNLSFPVPCKAQAILEQRDMDWEEE